MTRDLSKGIIAQKKVEQKSESKFQIKEEKLLKENKKQKMIKLTATIGQDEWDYLQGEVIKRSTERRKALNVSMVLREIIQENKKSSES